MLHDSDQMLNFFREKTSRKAVFWGADIDNVGPVLWRIFTAEAAFFLEDSGKTRTTLKLALTGIALLS